MKTKRNPLDAVAVVRQMATGGDPKLEAELEDIRTEMEIGAALFRLREAAGLTQAQLAERVGTSRTNITRLENADYEGHSMAMLRRVAQALGQRLVLAFEPMATVEPAVEEEAARARDLVPA
jgi:transcriptional regulator with XRE-family HTH domain